MNNFLKEYPESKGRVELKNKIFKRFSTLD